MFAKVAVIACFISLAYAGTLYKSNSNDGWYESGLDSELNYAGQSYAPAVSYTAAPMITKTVAVPQVSYAEAPAVSTVSQYRVISTPIVKTVAAPAVSYAAAPALSYATAPAVSTVSQYRVHSSPVAKQYATQLSYDSVTPTSYTSYVTPVTSFGGYGYGGYGSKYAW